MSDPELERRLTTLDARLVRLEAQLEALQDTAYRQSVRADATRAALRERTDPEWIARELSAVGAVLHRVCRRRRHGFWSGLAVLRNEAGRVRAFVLVVVAVFAQISRNWLMLHAVGVDASVVDATAVLIAMVTLSQLPVGPSVGAAATVLILGRNGPAAAGAAGVLLTATGTLGALAYVAWAGVDGVWSARRRGATRRRSARTRATLAGYTR